MCLGLVSCIGVKKFTILTEPAGAEISINGDPQPGKTPMTVEISQEKDLGIVASKPGYESAARTVPTKTSWFQALLWTKNDPRAQYIEEDSITIPLKKIPSVSAYRESSIPPYTGGGGRTRSVESAAPALRPMPDDLMP